LIGLVGLSILVPILRRHLHHPEQAPYLAAALLTVVTMVFSFLEHKNISFRPRKAEHKSVANAKTQSA
jgi:hypothetical protein